MHGVWRCLGLWLALLLAFGARPGWSGGKTVTLASLEWPPYTGALLDGEGVSSRVVRAAFAAVGYTVVIRFLPWKRAVDLAAHDPEVAGVFPEYHSSAGGRQFLYSDTIGSSPVGLVEPVDGHVAWKRLEDLAGLRIGTVGGYVNTEHFDRLVADGTLQVDISVNDRLNLRKVLAGRVDLAVVDRNVYRYLCATDPELGVARRGLRINDRLLGVNTLHVCFKPGPAGEILLRDFNEGLRRIDAAGMQRNSLEMAFPDR